jgi:sugar phosphate permease
MYFCYGVVMLTFLTWFPKYLSAARELNLKHMGIFASLPLAAALVGDICGGFFSDLLLKRTGRITFSRCVVAAPGFLIAGVCIPIAVTVADKSAPTPCGRDARRAANWPCRRRWIPASSPA